MKNLKSAVAFLSVSLMTLSCFAKAPPCVQWYGTCLKSKGYDGAFDGTGHVSYTRAAVKYETRKEDGSIAQSVWATDVRTYIAIPGIFGRLSEKRGLYSACKQMLAELESRRCE